MNNDTALASLKVTYYIINDGELDVRDIINDRKRLLLANNAIDRILSSVSSTEDVGGLLYLDKNFLSSRFSNLSDKNDDLDADGSSEGEYKVEYYDFSNHHRNIREHIVEIVDLDLEKYLKDENSIIEKIRRNLLYFIRDKYSENLIEAKNYYNDIQPKPNNSKGGFNENNILQVITIHGKMQSDYNYIKLSNWYDKKLSRVISNKNQGDADKTIKNNIFLIINQFSNHQGKNKKTFILESEITKKIKKAIDQLIK